MLSDPAYPTSFSIYPPAVRMRVWARMPGGSRPLGSSALLDARQDANSPHAVVWTTTTLGGQSHLFRWTALDACSLENSPAVVCAGARPKQKNTAPQDCSRNLCLALRVSLVAPCISALVERQRMLSPTTAAGHSLDRVGAVGGFVGAWAPTSLLGCIPGRGAILAALSGCQDGKGRCCPGVPPQPCSPGGSHSAASRVGTLRTCGAAGRLLAGLLDGCIGTCGKCRNGMR